MLDRSDEIMRLNKSHNLRLWLKVEREAKLFNLLFKVLAYIRPMRFRQLHRRRRGAALRTRER